MIDPSRGEPRVAIVGQRINASGSRLVRRLLLRGDDDGIVRVARAQLAAGAAALDVCVALPGTDGERGRMLTLLGRLRAAVDGQIAVDSVDPAVQLAGLELLGARTIVNSLNLAWEPAAIAAVATAARERGAAIVVQTIDEAGMALTAEEKLRLASRAVDLLAGRYGLPPGSILVDPLLFPVTGRGGAGETLAAVRRFKCELAGVGTILALGNGSFGLPPAARAPVERLLLADAAEAGLDLAIADPAAVLGGGPLADADRGLVADLVYRRRAGALERVLTRFQEPALDTPARRGETDA